MESKCFFLIYLATATLSNADVFSSVQRGTSLSNAHLDYQPNISLENCILLCWREKQCKSINYRGGGNLCELNRNDAKDVLKTEVNPRSMYSTKSKWTQGEISAVCSRRGLNSSPNCTKDSASSYCPKPEFVPETEVVLGNMARIGSKIRYACIIDRTNGTIYAVGVAECQDNVTWSDAWRPCTKPGMNYALGKQANQSTVYNKGFGPSLASYATDGNKTNDESLKTFTCAHTSDKHDWWYVDMEKEVVVGKVVVYLRTDNYYVRFRGISITVAKDVTENEANSGSQCSFFEGPISNRNENPVNFICQAPLLGRFVRITATTNNTLEMCEVEVYTKVTG